MKFVRRNKFTIIAIIILIILVFIGVELKNIFVPDEGKASYGDRLEGINDHKIKDKTIEEMKNKLKENDKVLDVENKIHGKIINLIITVSDDVDVNTAKGIANSTIGLFQEDELSFYSLQVYVKKNDANLNNFPIIGYKGVEAKELFFTKDREISSGDNK